jgi:hypothetical protein
MSRDHIESVGESPAHESGKRGVDVIPGCVRSTQTRNLEMITSGFRVRAKARAPE